MSDLSSLCPLFNTAVYSELTLPYINLGTVSVTQKLDSGYVFGRSVIITGAYIKRHTAFDTTVTTLKAYLCRQTSYAATKTVFASISLSASAIKGRWVAFTTTAKTFSATKVLALRAGPNTKTGGRHVSVIVRYKEK